MIDFRDAWCRRGDLNPHKDCSSLDPESSASANSATSALRSNIRDSNAFVKVFIFLKCLK